MKILDELISENEFPIVFIGSGMSKRFLANFPSWNELLKEFWDYLGLDNFYGSLNNIQSEINDNNPNATHKEIEHYTSMKIGTILEEKYNKEFNAGKITIKDFTPKDAYDLRISPFKKALSERFKYYRVKSEYEREFELFKEMLLKTQIILTTNYDTFIEDLYNEESDYPIDKYIGQRGFFKETYGYSEIYKIHGCVDHPKDIVITEKDYESFDDSSVLISAKIISMLFNSPIIFLGYSLSDTNVRNIIKEFTRALSEDEVKILENKLVFVERKKDQNELEEEIIDDRDLGCKVRKIKTNNFELVFQKISSINQGVAPSAIKKYQHVIKELIVDRGKKGTLDTVLLSPEELDKLQDNIQNKNLAVAIGDSKVIFQIPNIISYSLDYIQDNEEINTDIQLRFAATQQGRFPINKLLDKELINSSTLHSTEKRKLLNKIPEMTNFDKVYDSVDAPSISLSNTADIDEITKSMDKKTNVYETLSYNIKKLDQKQLKKFIVSELEELKEKGEINLSTSLRRLLLLYDIIHNKKTTHN